MLLPDGNKIFELSFRYEFFFRNIKQPSLALKLICLFYNRYGSDPIEAGKKFFILDEHGLITKARSNLLELEENFYDLTTFAEDDTSMEGKNIHCTYL